MHRRLLRLSPWLVTVVAVVVACAGTATAARLMISGKEVRNASLTGADIKDKSLTRKDFLGSVQGLQGPAGTPGAPGAPGAQGPPGTAASSGLVSGKPNEPKPVAVDKEAYQGALCPMGKVPVGGGADVYDLDTLPADGAQPGAIAEATITGSYPDLFAGGRKGWSAYAFNASAETDVVMSTYVICVDDGTTPPARGSAQTTVVQAPAKGLRAARG